MIDKSILIRESEKRLRKTISALDDEIQSLRESRAADGKSSAGDKHETGRAMADLELGRLNAQRQKFAKLRADLMEIKDSKATSIQLGSVVQTQKGVYFLAVPLGRVETQGQTVYVISTISPLGQALLGHSRGDSFVINGVTDRVEHCY
ncbi:MAG: 3-oxoacyl-ACP synthase [Bacteroidetes bacterium]|nr:3-oxoacyl-ACP synthase [Bacteroidota bacterium]MDA1336321.1 3-oxoacyl-ACP synthase [Bacteroidota bacterium]